jgi:hypothetical protein
MLSLPSRQREWECAQRVTRADSHHHVGAMLGDSGITGMSRNSTKTPKTLGCMFNSALGPAPQAQDLVTAISSFFPGCSVAPTSLLSVL